MKDGNETVKCYVQTIKKIENAHLYSSLNKFFLFQTVYCSVPLYFIPEKKELRGKKRMVA